MWLGPFTPTSWLVKRLRSADECHACLIKMGGERSATFAAFERLARRGRRAVPGLQELLMHGSPAGRLYGAIGLCYVDPAQGRIALEGLCQDDAPVVTMAGCRKTRHRVCEAAEMLLRNADSLAFFLPRRGWF